MVSLPQMPASFLCGEEPMRLPSRRRDGRRAARPPGSEAHPRRDRAEELARIVEGEIIPRLMLVHRGDYPDTGQSYGAPIHLGPETTENFALYALSSGHESLLAIVGNLLQQGVSMEAIYLDLLAPAARRLGDFWSDDQVSFADVSIAMGKLQRVVRDLSLHGPHDAGTSHNGRSALFAPAHGEQHTFGLVIVEEIFRRSGWRTWTELSGAETEIVSAARAHHFDMFGVTGSSIERLDNIALLIMSVRRASRNRDISIIVGGQLFLEHPELVTKVGADGIAGDGREALLKAEGAVRKLAGR